MNPHAGVPAISLRVVAVLVTLALGIQMILTVTDVAISHRVYSGQNFDIFIEQQPSNSLNPYAVPHFQ